MHLSVLMCGCMHICVHARNSVCVCVCVWRCVYSSVCICVVCVCVCLRGGESFGYR